MTESPQLKKRKMSPAPENGKSDVAPVAGLLIKRHSEKARLPTRGSALAAGYDLYRYVSWLSVYSYQHLFHDPRLGHPRLRSETKWIAGKLTLVISMLISRIVWLIWGSFRREFESFMISVDF